MAHFLPLPRRDCILPINLPVAVDSARAALHNKSRFTRRKSRRIIAKPFDFQAAAKINAARLAFPFLLGIEVFLILGPRSRALWSCRRVR